MSPTTPVGWILLFSLLAGLANLFGGLLVTVWVSWNRRFLRFLIAFSSGFMIAAALLEIAPHSTEYGLSVRQVGAWVLVGYLAMLVFEHVLPGHFHHSESRHQEPGHTHPLLHARSAYPAISGITLHSFFDGVAIGAGFHISPSVGLLLFLAVILHKMPVGATVSTLMLVTAQGSGRALAAAGVVGAATVLGALAASLPLQAASYALPFSAGVLLHVAASDLVPEIYEEPSRLLGFAVVLGAVAFAFSAHLLHSVVHL